MPHLQVESGPMCDPAQYTRLQRTVAILETTSLQTNLSHKVQNRRVQHNTPPDGFIGIARPSHFHLGSITRDAVSDLFSIPLVFSFGKMNRATRFPKLLPPLSQQLRTPCRCWFQPVPSVALVQRDEHSVEGGIPKFPFRRMSGQSVSVAMVPL